MNGKAARQVGIVCGITSRGAYLELCVHEIARNGDNREASIKELALVHQPSILEEDCDQFPLVQTQRLFWVQEVYSVDRKPTFPPELALQFAHLHEAKNRLPGAFGTGLARFEAENGGVLCAAGAAVGFQQFALLARLLCGRRLRAVSSLFAITATVIGLHDCRPHQASRQAGKQVGGADWRTLVQRVCLFVTICDQANVKKRTAEKRNRAARFSCFLEKLPGSVPRNRVFGRGRKMLLRGFFSSFRLKREKRRNRGSRQNAAPFRNHNRNPTFFFTAR